MIKYLFAKLTKKIQIPAIRKSLIDKSSKVCSGSHVVRCEIDRYTYIGNFYTVINTSIGSFCSIADNCIIGGASHPIDWVSTSPIFHEGKNVLKKNFSKHIYETQKKTIIGHDVWLGNNCIIKSGVKIGIGAIIGMGSVVTKDVGDYEIWAGNPAKLIRKRFDEDTINRLLNIKWWTWNNDKLQQESRLFNDCLNFIEKNNSQ